MICKKCGHNGNDNSKFCPECGENLGEKTKKKKKNWFVKFLGILLVLFIIFLLIPVDETDYDYDDDVNGNASNEDITDDSDMSEDTDSSSNDYLYDGVGTYGEDLNLSGLRDFYTQPVGNNEDINTIMVYLIGSDLETDGGFASTDIEEMLSAEIGDNLNLILMTGGSFNWHMDEISSDTCQYWQVKNGELISINDNLGQLNMASPETLTAFINDIAYAYPADRYSLIMWDHGGGTLGGFGVDEYYPDSILSLANLSDAFSQTDIKFDFVGFDACLMATAETALMLEPYADYLIASQELEPGTGWHYTNWLTNLSRYPSLHTVDIGANIVDDFVTASEHQIFYPNATLSVIELRQMPYTYNVLTDYFANSTIDIQNHEYEKLAQARSDAKDFGEGKSEQIDLVDYILKADVEGGQNVVAAVSSAVKYYYNSSDVENAYGMAMYYPYDYPNYYSDLRNMLYEVGYSEEYTNFFNTFISAMSGGQTKRSMNTGITLESDYSTEDWYDSETAHTYEESYDNSQFEELLLDEKGDDFVLSLSDEDWEEVVKIELQALIDDGEGYIDLGSDNVFEFDEDGDLKVEFDYTWVSFDGHTVPFYAEIEVVNSDDDWYTYGNVPAYLNNDEYVEIIVRWDNENPTGYVAGYRKFAETGSPIGKGLFELKPGDELDWIVDYYTYDWDYEDFYLYGDTYVVPEEEIYVSYEDIGNYDVLIYFVLTDLYNNVYETESIIYTD